MGVKIPRSTGEIKNADWNLHGDQRLKLSGRLDE